MIALLDTNEALDVCAAELGCEVHQLVTPAPGFCRQKEHDWFAIDNGAFANFDKPRFERLLLREREAKHLCKFVTVPDVVGDARRTLEAFEYWQYSMTGWPLALAAQDGLENLKIPWKQIQAIFIGGSTEWKLGPHARAVIRTARAIGMYVHVGRVNTPARFEYFESLGVDSIDGTGLAQYTHMREAIWAAYHQPNLLTDLVPNAENSFPRADSLSSTAAIVNATTAETISADEDLGSMDSLARQEGRERFSSKSDDWSVIRKSFSEQ